MTTPYLFAGQPTETERLRIQSIVWEPAGRSVLAQLPPGAGLDAVDVGCGAMGWLRVLSEWVGPAGRVVGSDIDEGLLGHARAFVDASGLRNVTLRRDDLFATRMPAASFDLVHARFQLAPLGRADEQLHAYRTLARRGGWIVLEEPDIGSWRVNPDSAAVRRLVELIAEGFRTGGGDFSAGRGLHALLRRVAREPRLEAHVVALPPGHPYLRLPLQFARSLRPRLEALVSAQALDELLRDAEAALDQSDTWGTTFTLIQAWAAVD